MIYFAKYNLCNADNKLCTINNRITNINCSVQMLFQKIFAPIEKYFPIGKAEI